MQDRWLDSSDSLRNVGPAGDGVRRADVVSAAALGHWIAIGDDTRAWRNAVAQSTPLEQLASATQSKAQAPIGAERLAVAASRPRIVPDPTRKVSNPSVVRLWQKWAMGRR